MLYLGWSCLNLALGIFLEFLGFSDYFSCFNVFSGLFLEFRMHWKIFRKKKEKKTYPNGPGPEARPGPPGLPALAQPRPGGAHPAGSHGRRRQAGRPRACAPI
jgi:hypothetical protein